MTFVLVSLCWKKNHIKLKVDKKKLCFFYYKEILLYIFCCKLKSYKMYLSTVFHVVIYYTSEHIGRYSLHDILFYYYIMVFQKSTVISWIQIYKYRLNHGYTEST